MWFQGLRFLVGLAVSAGLSGAALAHDYQVGDLEIGHPMAFDTPQTAMAGAGYLSITNAGQTADRLIEVRADFPQVMMHTTEEKDGVARMMHVDAIKILPGETVVFEPGGYHVMFMGLAGDPFEAGEQIPATLVFEEAGEIEVMFSVESRTSESEGQSGNHDH